MLGRGVLVGEEEEGGGGGGGGSNEVSRFLL